jgi:hypothetical protein
MTVREVYEYSLIETNKVEAPTLLLEDYNYLINKAILAYINKKYNVYGINQQSDDDLNPVKGSAHITSLTAVTGNKLQGATYTATLPLDYFHLLNCTCEFLPASNFSCYTTTNSLYYGAKRMTADMWPEIINNAYLRPSYRNPYFYLNSVVDVIPPTNTGSNFDPVDGSRNQTFIAQILEIRYGRDNTKFILNSIDIQYIKSPRYIILTQGQVDATSDTSDIMEFPNYICLEIIKELVALLLENASDPRLNTNLPINQTIAPPSHGQAQQSRKR